MSNSDWQKLDLTALPDRVKIALQQIAAVNGLTIAELVAECVLVGARRTFVTETARALEAKNPNGVGV